MLIKFFFFFLFITFGSAVLISEFLIWYKLEPGYWKLTKYQSREKYVYSVAMVA